MNIVFRDADLGGATLTPAMLCPDILNSSNKIDFAEQYYDETENASPTYGQNGKIVGHHRIDRRFDSWLMYFFQKCI